MSNKLVEDIWTQIKTLIVNAQATGQPLEYVKTVLEGYRENLPIPGTFPCIMLNPVEEVENMERLPYHPKIKFTLDIYCVTHYYNYDKQIASQDTAVKGIFDFVADVKNVLWADPGLSGKATLFKMPRVNYLFWTHNNYNFRAGVIQIETEVEATQTGR